MVTQLVESAAMRCLPVGNSQPAGCSQQVAATFSLLADAVASGGFFVFCSPFGCVGFGE